MDEQTITDIAEIRKIPKDGKFWGVGVVSKWAVRKDRNGKDYWDIGIMDSGGVIEGKVWQDAQWFDKRGERQVAVQNPVASELFGDMSGRSLGFRGQVTEFKGQPQYKFLELYYVDQEKFPPHEFVQRSPVPQQELEERFRALLALCGEPVGDFLDFLFFGRGLWEKFKNWPAAVSFHHAYVGGLLEHTVSMAEAARALARQYGEIGYDVDLPVTLAGALLHDIGKIGSYWLSPAPEMTVEGTVIDHIVMGYETFAAAAREFGLEERLFRAIGHILVSHHGCREYGSPVLPATPEAMIVSAVDELDFRLFCWRNAVEELESGREISDYVPSVQRRFWRWKE